MEVTPDPRIFAANLLNSGLILKFDNGRCAFYSCKLLNDTFPLADELDETELAW